MIRHRAPWDARSTISRSAHVLERIGLALTGASCGLFVAAHVGRAELDLIGDPEQGRPPRPRSFVGPFRRPRGAAH